MEKPIAPFFSLVIPVYNRFHLVKDTVQSIMEQEFKDFEIIIVDDGSNDGSEKMLDDHYRNIDLIKIIHQVNLERGAARNRGFKAAIGEYVIFLDSDDRLLDDHLKTLYQYIESLGRPDFIATKFEFLSDGKRKGASIGLYDEGYYDYKLFLDGNPFGCNVCVRRNNEKIILFEEDKKYAIKEDWLFFLINLRYQNLYLIDRVTLLMLDHEDRSMRSNNELLISKTGLAVEWIRKNVLLSARETRKLVAHANYFCAIHSYLDGHRKKSLYFIVVAFAKGGLRIKYFVLAGKILIGRKMILRYIHGS